MLSVVIAEDSAESGSLIDEIVRESARRMLAAALEAEVNQDIAELAAETDVAACPRLALLLSVGLLNRALKRQRLQAATFHSSRILP
ncbi:hypothetical protein [Streptomyces sp. NPDC000618]|uniref:hypothetical protein n=1 Tax=Streptomyces sp. NPDC000618 TaxID=3154265 RepID=UPI00332C4560